VAAVPAAISSPARADERALLDHGEALLAHAAAQSHPAQPVSANADDAGPHRRQIIREGTLRDAGISVDENGRPLR
jgi:hypothetical protein